MTSTALDSARAIADAVLWEGYLLYPYRASSRKNQVRWQFGVLGPAGAVDAGVGEDFELRTECLLQAAPAALVDVRLRFLQLQARTVERAEGDEFVPVAELRSGASTWLTWDEAVEREVDVLGVALDELVGTARTVDAEIAGGEDVETVRDPDGTVVGRLRRRRWPLRATLELGCTPVHGPGARPRPAETITPAWSLAPNRAEFTALGAHGSRSRDRFHDGPRAWSLRVRVRNAQRSPVGADRDEANRMSFIGAHLVLAARDGRFVSLLEPPDWAQGPAAGADNYRCWPVLVGERQPDGPDRSGTVLASPIILYDWPAVAAESAGELFDSTEIDEILSLRVMTMTEDEKREARATDPRAGAIVDRCDDMSAETLQRLHGATREPSASVPTFATDDVPTFGTAGTPWWDPAADASVSPGTDAVEVGGVRVAKGSTVRLRPSRRADAQDLFFAGRTATVAGVHHDVDGNVHVAVTVTDDPAADLHEWYGRFLYFGPDEIEPIDIDVSTNPPVESSR